MIASLVATSSVIGILKIAGITHSYPTDDLEQAFLPNDVVNLILGVPLLLVAAYNSYLLPGTLLYQVYTSLTYVLVLMEDNTKLGAVFFLQTTILISCCVFLPDAYGAADKKIQAAIRHKHHYSTIQKDPKEEKSVIATSTAGTRMGGGILLLWGSLFFVRSLYRLLVNNEDDESSSSRSPSERAVDIADIVIGVTWVFGGFQLIRYSKIALGQALLFQGSMLFVALIMLLIIKPFMIPTETFHIVDVAVVGSMGVTVFVPFFIIDQGLRDITDRIKVA